MANRIEITVAGKNQMPATFAEVKAQADAFGSSAGADTGGKFSSAFTSAVNDAVPPAFKQQLAPKIQDPVRETGTSSGAAFTAAFTDVINDAIPPAFKDQLGPKIQDPVKESGKSSGAAFTSAFSGEMKSGLADTGVFGSSIGDAIGKEGDPAGRKFGVTFSQSAKDSLASANLAGILGDSIEKDLPVRMRSAVVGLLAPDGPVGAPMVEDAEKTGTEIGKKTGTAAADGMSPLIVGAIGAAAGLGAPLLLAGLGTAFVGITALALKSNAVIAADYTKLGKDAETAITKAAAPLAGDLNQGLATLDGTVKALQPQLDTLFSNVGPDITQVASGVSAFASGVLPGLSQALGGSQVIVKDFSSSMGPLGSSVGSFFTGLTRDASTTGAGMQSAFGVIGNAVSTLGSVLGSASSAISADLMAIDPAINSLLTGVRALASPATVGALGGVFGAMKLDPGISNGLGSMSKSLKTFASDAESTSGMMGTIKGAAGGMSGALGKAANVMSGPWGIAIGAGVGLLSGLAGSLYSAAHASDAVTLSQQGLAQAVAQDGGAAGQATAAFVAQSAATDGLSDSASKAGVSTALWTQAVLGSKDAQNQVVSAVDKLNQSQQDQAKATANTSAATGKYATDLRDAKVSAADGAAANNTLTATNQKLIASMNAETKQVADAIATQTKYEQAMNDVTSTKQLFDATLKAGYESLVANTQATSMNTVAALNLGTNSSALNQKLYQSVNAYNLAAAQGSAYGTVLQSLNGTTMNVDQAQNTLAQQMLTAKTSFSANKQSLDLSTQAGISNRQSLTAAATAITALGVAQYQATGDINKGNQTIAQQITAFVNATGATGKAKTAIETYLQSITKIPSNVSTDVNANTSPAQSKLNSLLKQINGSTAWVTIDGSVTSVSKGSKILSPSYATGGAVSFAASGGAQGGFTWMNEQGPELVNLPTGAQVMPASNTAAMLGGGMGPIGSSSQTEVTFSGNTDSAFATYVMLLIRQGKIQIKQKAIVP